MKKIHMKNWIMYFKKKKCRRTGKSAIKIKSKTSVQYVSS